VREDLHWLIFAISKKKILKKYPSQKLGGHRRFGNYALSLEGELRFAALFV